MNRFLKIPILFWTVQHKSSLAGREVMLREGEGDYLMMNTGIDTVSCTRNLELAQW